MCWCASSDVLAEPVQATLRDVPSICAQVTVQKPRTDAAWDHAYSANLIDVTPHGFVVEVARLDKDAGWCYELELQWMAYGFAVGDEQMIGRDPDPYSGARSAT